MTRYLVGVNMAVYIDANSEEEAKEKVKKQIHESHEIYCGFAIGDAEKVED